MRRLRFLLPYFKPYRSILLAGLLWLLVTDVLGLLGPWLLKVGIDAVQQHRAQTLYGAGLLLAVMALLRYATRSRSRHCFLHTACRLENDLRQHLLARLLQQGGSFFDRYRTGDLLSRFTNDIGNLRTLAGFGLMIFVNTLMVYGMTLVVLLGMSPVLTLVALLPYPLLFLLTRYLSSRLLAASAKVQRGLGQVSETLEEGIGGHAVIRSYGLRSLRGAYFDTLNERYLHASLVLARLRNAIGPSMALIAPLGTLLVLYFGGRRVIDQQLSLGELVAFNAYLVQLTMPTLMLGWILGLVQRGAASAERLADILQLQQPPKGLPIAQRQGPPAVCFRNLTFGYVDKPVLRDLQLEVAPGSLIGVAGPTGSGKSTLLRLLAGLYVPEPEQLFIDGRDLTQLDGGAYRQRVAMVPQEGRLFSGSLRDNLLYAVPDADDNLLQKVVEAVCLQDDIAGFAQGFDTRVGEGGQALSGGQRQRVCLGRALARDAGLWLLDDPFSHLDAATAQSVWRQLRRWLVGKTVFLASGQASLLAGADRIVVLDAGRLVESGTYDALRAQKGVYARLLEKERLQRELEGLS
ncbi:ABC transporter, ATP-binding/membrane protein [Syntrophotalea carbinolica DSM 2380]|uniref:ABC transporter, ATP-binding/membrane protein n=1 Tax=Syntrophotalea carbinolica (strain DSM 2380 / NBRC 103641 / GraBd1) TaxID=338963 RepID=Q3A8J1_SYNC1|nr:ABC transporter ATP-binding protein [Syntrophotalea carbinolica]ABA87301.1 ABC transporter, ATP-binding/membrane protein [Syntrophotalea carbinolica DSM 2380]